MKSGYATHIPVTKETTELQLRYDINYTVYSSLSGGRGHVASPWPVEITVRYM